MLRIRRIGPQACLALALAGFLPSSWAAVDLPPRAPAPDFVQRMIREARREFGRAPDPIPEAAEDPELTEVRARSVERIVRRSVRGALGDRLEPLLSALPGLEAMLQKRDLPISGGPPAREPPPGAGAAGPGAPPPAPALSGSLGFRLDAHPRLLIRGRLHAVRGVLEVPVLDREIRLSLDRPLGSIGTATLRGGLSGEQGDWVTLSINLRF